ncbi:DUF4197 domain-containing protein [Cytophagales bacterium LB-30]|uniref:DUF4197 domain-containing protein n=1 Tax=Shiella aurantiaca TaxID=3058365 RepID=A0ABT8F6C6_9BACT|nr:DUF4197 domain-containing protein [Shiella aurantiaca]MDN4166000.1 DUF4197 domain-containing protein [Shiella aurantiaca]
MRKLLLTLMVFGSVSVLSSCDVLQGAANQAMKEMNKGGGGLTSAEVVKGLKEALKIGAEKSVSALSQNDAYFKNQALKIFLPQEAQTVIDKLNSSSAGRTLYNQVLKSTVDDMVLSLNRAAEKAAVKAKPIFVNAITGMTIQDAFGILKGADTAATNYLRRTTFNSLVNAYKPEVNTVLNQKILSGKSTNDIYNTFVKNYNSLATNPLNSYLKLEKVKDTDLADYVTRRGLNGLFTKVAAEEKNIRDNPSARVTDILKKVFAQQ